MGRPGSITVMQNKPGLLTTSPAALIASLFLALQPQPMDAAMRPNEAYTAYWFSNYFATPMICTVNGGPVTLSNASPFIADSIVLHTDGAGKITGTGWFWIDYVTGPSAPWTALSVDVTGKISSSPTHPIPVVTLLLKGSGDS